MGLLILPELDRCNPPDCVRMIGHAGPCRPTRQARTICAKPLPRGGVCWRKAGHNWGCRSRNAMLDNSEKGRRDYRLKLMGAR